MRIVAKIKDCYDGFAMSMSNPDDPVVLVRKQEVIERPFKENDHNYEMLDGKQRLTALLEFQEGLFSYKGLTYPTMCKRDRRHFDDFSISLGQSDPLTEEQKMRYFLKLNMSGTPMDPKHMEAIQKKLDEIS